MSFNPLVSIIIPVYNGADFLTQAIDSALSQTYSNIEVIVVNDGSTDGGATESIALSYGEKIRYFHKENGGVSTALNLGISVMKGEYFSWLSHDDKYLPCKIQNQIDMLSENYVPDLIALCGVQHINADSKLISKPKIRKGFKQGETIDWEDALLNLIKHGCFSGCSLLIPKKVFDQCDGFAENLRFSQDYFMWLKIFLQKYKLIYSVSPDVQSRIHDKQLTQTGRDMFKKDSLYIAEKLVPQLTDISSKKKNFLYHFVKCNAKYGVYDVYNMAITSSKGRSLFGMGERFVLMCVKMYGSVRPTIRKIYYRVFRKVTTK